MKKPFSQLLSIPAREVRRAWILLSVVFLFPLLGAEEIELPLLGRSGLNIYSAMTYSESDGSFLTDGISGTRNRLVRIGLIPGGKAGEPVRTESSFEIREYFEVHRFYGQSAGKLLVATIDRDHILTQALVDPVTLKRQALPSWRIQIDWALVAYRNGSFFSARLDGSGSYTPYRFSPATRSLDWLDIRGVPTSLTADTLHLLVHNPDSGEIFIWSTEKQASAGRLRSNAPAGQVRFLTSGTLLVPPEYSGKDRWRLHDLEGRQTAELTFRIAAEEPLFIWFSADLSRAVVCIRGSLNPEIVVVNAEPLRRWLIRAGHLFAGTSGVLNDSRVRVREYPTLEAKVVGLLDRGVRVELLDRSGLKIPIDDMNDYWYRVRTESGLTGWSYGHFIDLP